MIKINGQNYNSTANVSPNTAPGFNFGTIPMGAAPELYEPQRSNNFEFILDQRLNSLKRAGTLDTSNGRYANVTGGQEIIRIATTRTSVPSFSQGQVDVKRGNTTIHYAGVPTFSGPQEVTLNDYIGTAVYDVLAAWQNLSYNVKTEKVGLAADYKMTCTLVEYTPDYQKVKAWKLYGCWITDLTSSELNQESNEVVKITAKICYDRFEIVAPDEL